MEKHKHFLLDILIGVLIIAAVILIDHLIINLKSKPADEDWNNVNVNGQEGKEEEKGNEGLYQLKEGEKAFAPILNFHRIDKAPLNADKITRSYFIEPDKLEEIIKGIINNDYESVFASELVGYLEKKELPLKQILAITFDDGNEDFSLRPGRFYKNTKLNPQYIL